MSNGWKPTVAQVAATIPTRGGQDGSFDETTRPTATQVADLIESQANDLIGEVGSFDSATVINPAAPAEEQVTLAALARNAVQLGTASQIEDVFFPEQQAGQYAGLESTPSQHLYARYRRAVERLKSHVDLDRDPEEFTGSVPLRHASRRAL